MAKQSFFDFINDQSYETLKPLWNEYVAETGDGEQIFEGVEDLTGTFEFEPLEFARMVFFGELRNWGDDVYINGYGNIKSCWSVDSSPISTFSLTEWLAESNHEFYKEWLWEQEE